MLTGNFAQAQGNGNGKDHERHGDDDDQGEHYYKDHERETMRPWYDDHENDLPPGLAKREQLSPELETQLVRRGTLHQDFRNDSNVVPKILGGYRHRLLIARTC